MEKLVKEIIIIEEQIKVVDDDLEKNKLLKKLSDLKDELELVKDFGEDEIDIEEDKEEEEIIDLSSREEEEEEEEDWDWDNEPPEEWDNGDELDLDEDY